MDEYLTGKPGGLVVGRSPMQKRDAAYDPSGRRGTDVHPGRHERKSGDTPSSSSAFDLPASGSELRNVREELIREFRKMGTQVQNACAEEIRSQTQNLLQELRQEIHSRPGSAGVGMPWEQATGISNVVKLHKSPRKSHAKAEGWNELSTHWMPEAVIKAQAGEIKEGDVGPKDGHLGKWLEERTRQAWPAKGDEADDDPWALPRPGTQESQVDPPQLPFDVPLPPPDPPQVECNGDAAAGQPGRWPKVAASGVRASTVSFYQPAEEELFPDNRSDSSCSSSPQLKATRATTAGTIHNRNTRRLSLGLQTARRSRRLKEKEKPPLCSMSATEILKSSRFDNFMGIVILCNAVTIGVQTDYASRNITENFPQIFGVLEKWFCGIFVLELLLRLYVHRMKFFTRWGWNVLWNYFDLFVVVAQVAEESLMLAAQSSGLDLSSFRLLRVLRVLRLVRIFRVIRVLHLISELRTIISSIMGSFRSLGWTVVLLFLMIYIVGVYFTQSITDYFVEKYSEGQQMSTQDANLRYYFSDLFRAILSLWQAMSGGADWDSMAGPLVAIDVTMGIAFAAYIAFALLALMNVVTGVFVQTALQNAKDEEDAFLTDQIVKVFERCSDSKKKATITMEEINTRLEDPEIQGEWKSINVSPEEAHYLFELLDIDQTGEIAFEEFLSGCLRLHGTSKSMDLLTVMQECRSEFRSWHEQRSKWDRFMEAHRQFSQCFTNQVNLNNCVLQQFLEKAEGTWKAAAINKEFVNRMEQKIKPMEKSLEVVKSMLRSPGGLETIFEAMAPTEGEGAVDPSWHLRSRVDEV